MPNVAVTKMVHFYCNIFAVDCQLTTMNNMEASGGTIVTERIIRSYDDCLLHCLRMVRFSLKL